MKSKKLVILVSALTLITLIGVAAVGTAFAQDPTPTPGAKAPFWGRGLDRGFGIWGGKGMGDFDAIAKALNLTPTQLFEQLHSGKKLDEIAKAQGVDLTKLQETASAARLQAMKDQIAQAVKDGKMTQDQANWLLQGLDKGYMGKGDHFGFGGPMMRGGMRGFGGKLPGQTPSKPAPGKTS